MIDFVRVGMKITKYRRLAGMTQDELSEKLYVTRQALSKWENGTGVPSTETLLDLCQIFNVSFEDLLCLNDDKEIEINQNNIFHGHERLFIINKLINNELNVNIPDVFYQLSPSERMYVLKAVKENRVSCNVEELYVKLTTSEQKYLWSTIIKGGNYNDNETSNN